MNRTRNKKRAKPRPGAAKLNTAIDHKMEEKADEISTALIQSATEGNPTCLHILVNLSKDAEFVEECVKTYSEGLIDRWEREVREQMALPASEEGAETTAGAREPES